jgi:hypothetical protein
MSNRHCGLVVRVSGYRARVPGSSTIEELLGRKNSGSSLEKPRIRP